MIERVLVGLGNPGTRFAGTRHNLGQDVVKAWVERHAPGMMWQEHKDCGALIAVVNAVLAVIPMRGMNVSGEIVACVARQRRCEAQALVVVHDDIELPLGRVSVRSAGSAAGHNGVRSLHAAFGTQAIRRLRLGIGRPPDGVAVDQYVLEPFLDTEKTIVSEMIDEAVVLLDTVIAS